MIKTIVVHSAREGTGKSTLVANMAVLMAKEGLHVGVVDADLQSGCLRYMFGLQDDHITYTLNDYLFGRCERDQVVYDLSHLLNNQPKQNGTISLIPSTKEATGVAWDIRGRYDISLFLDGLTALAQQIGLDVLLFDTHAMISDDTVFSMLSIAMADTLLLMLSLDQRDYQSTSVIVDVGAALEVNKTGLVASQVGPTFALDDVKKQLTQTYKVDIAEVLPYTDEIMLMGMSGIFVLEYPNHPITKLIANITAMAL
jgi:MinD-like ATPase involved in chromosome partitioning or flagellar assembly